MKFGPPPQILTKIEIRYYKSKMKEYKFPRGFKKVGDSPDNSLTEVTLYDLTQ